MLTTLSRTVRFTLVLVLGLVGSARAGILTPDEAKALADAGALTIVDVRLPMEWAETGRPAGALGVSLQDPATFQVRPDFVAELLRRLDGDRDRPIALICATGQRSTFATKLLQGAGFTNVQNIAEGVLGGPNGPGWLQRGLPVQAYRAP